MTTPVIRGEDGVRIDVLFRDSAEEPLNISGGTPSVELWYRQKVRTTFEVDDGLTIENEDPGTDSPQQAHGYVTLTSETTKALPIGRVAYLLGVFVDTLGSRFETEKHYLEVSR